MDPREFLDVSRFLAEPPRSLPAEASHRTAFGRAYYAAFGHGREVLKAGGFAFPGDLTEHEQLITYLKKSSITTVQAAGGVLDTLRRQRNSADYDVGAVRVREGPFVQYMAVLVAIQAVQIIETIDAAARQDKKLGIRP